MLPTVHYNMGGVPTNYMGEVLAPTPDNPDKVRGRVRVRVSTSVWALASRTASLRDWSKVSPS